MPLTACYGSITLLKAGIYIVTGPHSINVDHVDAALNQSTFNISGYNIRKRQSSFPLMKIDNKQDIVQPTLKFSKLNLYCFIGVIEPPDYADITGDSSLSKSNSINNRQHPALYEDDYLQPRSQASRHLKDSHQYINVDMPGKFLVKFL